MNSVVNSIEEILDTGGPGVLNGLPIPKFNRAQRRAVLFGNPKRCKRIGHGNSFKIKKQT